MSRLCGCAEETESDLIFVTYWLWLQMENGLGGDEARRETGLLRQRRSRGDGGLDSSVALVEMLEVVGREEGG